MTQSNDNRPELDLALYSSYGAYQAPLLLSWIAALRGLAKGPLTRGFTYAEIGCGAGVTLAVLADIYRDAKFIGIEGNLMQAERARALARDTGLSNLEIRHLPLEAPQAFALPSCEVISIAGLFSWLPEEERRRLVHCLAESLAPGGMLAMQYGALPGNSHVDLLYTLLKTLGATSDGDAARQLAAALPQAAALAREGGLFFRQTPPAAEILQRLANTGPEIASLEVSRSGRHSLYHSEIAMLMEGGGLSYAGSGQLELNHLELSVPHGLRTAIEAIKPGAAREVALDFARNTAARADVYIKTEGAEHKEPGDALASFMLARLAPGDETLARQQISQQTGVDFTAGVYDDLLRTIGPKPLSVAAVFASEAMRKHARARALRALQLLVGQRMVLLVRTEEEISQAPPPAKIRFTSKLNEKLVKDWMTRPDPVPLAAPVIGHRALVSAGDRWHLHALMGGSLELVFQQVTEQGLQISDREGKPATAQSFRDSIMGDLEAFRVRTAAQLVKLGVLAPA